MKFLNILALVSCLALPACGCKKAEKEEVKVEMVAPEAPVTTEAAPMAPATTEAAPMAPAAAPEVK